MIDPYQEDKTWHESTKWRYYNTQEVQPASSHCREEVSGLDRAMSQISDSYPVSCFFRDLPHGRFNEDVDDDGGHIDYRGDFDDEI